MDMQRYRVCVWDREKECGVDGMRDRDRKRVSKMVCVCVGWRRVR